MINIISNILLALTLSLDSFGIGIAYGIKGVKIPNSAKLIIFTVSFVFAQTTVLLGSWLVVACSPFIGKFIGFIVLLGIGIYTVLGDPFTYDTDKSEKIEKLEALLMGLALSADSAGVGIGSAASGFSSEFLPVSVSICQLIALFAGELAGQYMVDKKTVFGRLWTIAAGIIIIIFGILRLFD